MRRPATEGFEITGNWRGKLAREVRLSVSAGYGFFKTKLDALRPNTVLPTLPLLGTRSILLLTQGQPLDKFTLSADLQAGRVGLTANIAAFGSYSSLPAVNVQSFGSKTTADFGVRFRITDWLGLSAGILNAFDQRCDGFADNGLAAVIASTGGSFPTGEECPVGLNGRTYYARLGLKF